MEELFSNTGKSECIICAAIHFNDGIKHEHQPKNIAEGFVICGRRHHNCYATAWVIIRNESITDKMTEANGKAVQGFLTSKDIFLNRQEAGALAYRIGQINRPTDCLFSEDLY